MNLLMPSLMQKKNRADFAERENYRDNPERTRRQRLRIDCEISGSRNFRINFFNLGEKVEIFFAEKFLQVMKVF